MLSKVNFKKHLILLLIITIALPSISFLASAKTTYKNIKLKAEKTTKVILGYSYAKDYKVKIKNTKIAKIKGKITTENYQSVCKIKGIKKGKTKAIVYVKNNKIGSFKINVGRPDAKIDSTYKKLTLKYNKNGSTAYMSESHIYLNDLIKNPHPKGKYSVFIDNHNIISNTNDGNIYTVNKGKTKITVYEKLPKKAKRNIGTITVNVKNSKMSYVVKENMKFYPQGIFGKGNKYECLHIDGNDNTLDINSRIKDCLINNQYTGSEFKKSQYNIKYTSLNKNIATVTSKGKVIAQSEGSTKIKYTITFSDNSKFVGYCHIQVEKSIT